MRFRILGIACLCLVLFAASGCSKRYRIEIQSDVCWSGSVNDNKGISGCGNSTYKVVGRLGCIRMQKLGSTGYLRVRVDQGRWNDAADANGQILVCQ